MQENEKQLTYYEVFDHVWKKILDAKKSYFDNLLYKGFEGTVYGTVVNVCTTYLDGKTRNILIQTDDDSYVVQPMGFADALYETLKHECDLTINRQLLKELDDFVKMHKGNIKTWANEERRAIL